MIISNFKYVVYLHEVHNGYSNFLDKDLETCTVMCNLVNMVELNGYGWMGSILV